MAKEIEKKYLILENWEGHMTDRAIEMFGTIGELSSMIIEDGVPVKQGYLSINSGLELGSSLGMNVSFKPVEARLRDRGGKFYFTLKGDGSLSRNELESEIEKSLFGTYWKETIGKRVEKIRANVPYGEYIAEFDMYSNRDLITAEVEVPTIEEAKKLVPLGLDITEDKSYKNKNLAC